MRHWVVGLGLHRRLTESEYSRLSELVQKPILQHHPDECTVIEESSFGSFGIFSPLLQTEWTLTVGVMEVHQYAGVSGGYKGVVVGCGSGDVIAHLHRRDMVCHPNVEVGRIEGNPFREEIERLGVKTPCRFGLMWVPSLGEWWFGTPSQLLSEAKQQISPWYKISQPVDTVVLKVPSSKGETLYQASRAATYLALSPSPPLREGGTIILEASMAEGLGSEQGFCDALQRFRPPWSETLYLDLAGAGAQRIWMLARLAQRFHLVLSGVENPDLFRSIGLVVSDDLEIEKGEWLLVEQPFTQIPQG